VSVVDKLMKIVQSCETKDQLQYTIRWLNCLCEKDYFLYKIKLQLLQPIIHSKILIFNDNDKIKGVNNEKK